MTVREMLEKLSELPLDREMYIEFDEGSYIQYFPLKLAQIPFNSDYGMIFESPQLNDEINENFTPMEEF